MKRTFMLLLFLAATLEAVAGAAGTVPNTDIKYIAEYPDARTTGYVTAKCELDNGNPVWCSPSHQSCLTSENQILQKYKGVESCLERDLGWCCIPESERGFYEDVRCQGSGVCKQKTYNTETITRKPGKNALPEKYEKGVTFTEEEPEKKHTIATNIQEGSDCYLPMGTNVYIDFGPGNQWSGQYVAEDIGSGFQGDGKAENGNCKIDIYTGVGEEAKNEAEEKVTRAGADVYILEWGDESTEITRSQEDTDEQETTIQKGFLETEYKYTNNIPIMSSLQNKVQGLNSRLNQCSSADDTKTCLQRTVNDAKTKTWNVQSTCGTTDQNAVSVVKADESSVLTEGTVLSTTDITPSPGNTDEPASRTVTVNDTEESLSTITLQSTDLDKLLVNRGDRIQIRRSYQTPDSKLNVYRADLDSTASIRILSTPKHQIIKYLTDLASCMTANEMCVCDVKNNLDADIKLMNGTATTQQINQKPQAYFFTHSDGGNIPTGITSQLINQQQLDFNLIRQKAQLAESKPNITLPSQSATYFLVTPKPNSDSLGKLSKLDERPEWYQGSINNDAYQEKLKTNLKNIISNIQKIQNPTSFIKGDQKAVPACEPQRHYQSICIQKRRGADVSPPISMPPVKYTIKI